MSLLKKSTNPNSSRQQIRIKGVRDSILLLPDNEYRLVIEVSSVNFELMSETEQDAIIDTYQSFLNSLSTPFQILVRIRELDMDKYLESFNSSLDSSKDQAFSDQAESYTKFVRSLVSDNKILTRSFYIVLPHRATSKTDFDVVKEQLKLTGGIVAKGLGRLGMQTRKLSSIEILDLFYSFYSPQQAKRQPLNDQTMQVLKESYL